MKAKFIFVGPDANYPEDVETSLPEVSNYFHDGVTFWQATGFHHPFMLPKVPRGTGKKYHEQFKRSDFEPTHADSVTFVELLHVPRS